MIPRPGAIGGQTLRLPAIDHNGAAYWSEVKASPVAVDPVGSRESTHRRLVLELQSALRQRVVASGVDPQ